MGKNIQRLGNTLANRMNSTARAAVPTSLELGTIGRNMSLTTDSLRTEIPKGEYMINLMLTGGSRTGKETAGEAHSHEMPAGYRNIKGGDRVLVAWCGNEPVVIAILVSS